MSAHRAYVAVGSNLGDRRRHLTHALHRMADLGEVAGGSPIYETAPVGGPSGQGPYLNAVIGLDTDLAAGALLDRLLAIESERGRTRTERWGARTLDLDLLWHAGGPVREAGLTVPHPLIRERPFVLAPLADVAPHLADASGAYVDALFSVDMEGIEQVSGPVTPDGAGWMTGLAEATEFGGEWSIRAHPDWANTSGDAFGGFLAAVALRAAGATRPGSSPSHMTYRYLHPVPSGSHLGVSVATHRSSASSADMTVTLTIEGSTVGRCAVGVVDRPLRIDDAPPMPQVMSMAHARPVTELVGSANRTPGASIRSWTPLERWDVPDLADGTEPVLRAWSPNVVMGSGNPFLHAASLVMPIDALIWPATLQRLGRLPSGPAIATPTIELTARFGAPTRAPWFLGEAHIDHRTDRSVSGTVRVWDDTGEYLATGHSLNLLRR